MAAAGDGMPHSPYEPAAEAVAMERQAVAVEEQAAATEHPVLPPKAAPAAPSEPEIVPMPHTPAPSVAAPAAASSTAGSTRSASPVGGAGGGARITTTNPKVSAGGVTTCHGVLHAPAARCIAQCA